MYEKYSRQALPEKYYRELLGSSLCIFNSNNNFIIENILKSEPNYSWHDLIDWHSGKLKTLIPKHLGQKIYEVFDELVNKRNRIIHSFQITHNDYQILATKDPKNQAQFIITEEYLLQFIKDNEFLSSLLHDFRGY